MVNTKPKKYTKFVGFRVTPGTKTKLEKLSIKEMRTVTSYMRSQLDDFLKTHK